MYAFLLLFFGLKIIYVHTSIIHNRFHYDIFHHICDVFDYIHPPLVAHGFQLQYPKANAIAAIDYGNFPELLMIPYK